MPKRIKRNEPGCRDIEFVNTSTTTDILANSIVIVLGMLYVAAVDIPKQDANGLQSKGTLYATGEIEFSNALNTDTWSQGQALGYDRTNDRPTTNLEGGIFFQALKAKVNGDTVVRVVIDNRRKACLRRSPTAGEASGNQVTWDTGLGFVLPLPKIAVVNNSGVPRLPATLASQSGGNAGKIVFTGGGTALVVTDFINAEVDY